MAEKKYARTVAAAVGETKSKFKLAEALAEEIPARKTGPGDDAKVMAYLAEARQAVIDAGGEPKSIETLKQYRATALWVGVGTNTNVTKFRWISKVSYTAHNEARQAGITYVKFAADPKPARETRQENGRPSKDGDPEKVVKGWSQKQREAAVDAILDDPDDGVVVRLASHPKVQAKSKPTPETVSRAMKDDPEVLKAAKATADELEFEGDPVLQQQFRDAEKNRKEERRRKHSDRYWAAEKDLQLMIRLGKRILVDTTGVEFDQEELELLADDMTKLSAVIELVKLRFTGTADVDWDAELNKLSGGEE